LGGRGGT